MAIKLNGSTSGSVALDAPADTSPSGTDVTLTLPTSAGSSGQYLQTNGSGTLSWQTLTTGKILQVVQSTPNADVESTTSTTYGDIPDLTATITPSSTSSKILILTDLSLSASHAAYIRLFRGTTEIGSGNAASGRETLLYQVYSGAGSNGPFYYGFANPSKVVLDSPATTSPTTYKYQWRTNAGTLYLNRTYQDSGNYIGRTASNITLLEVSV